MPTRSYIKDRKSGRKERDYLGQVKKSKGGAGMTNADSLRQRLSNRGAGGNSGSGTIATAPQESYMVVPSREGSSMQQAVIAGWRREYANNMSEGRAGENQVKLLHSGPRKTMDSVSSPLKYGVNFARKTITQRMMESGKFKEAMGRMTKSNRTRRGPKLRAGSIKNYDTTCLGVQMGLNHESKDSAKFAKKKKRMDVNGL